MKEIDEKERTFFVVSWDARSTLDKIESEVELYTTSDRSFVCNDDYDRLDRSLEEDWAEEKKRNEASDKSDSSEETDSEVVAWREEETTLSLKSLECAKQTALRSLTHIRRKFKNWDCSSFSCIHMYLIILCRLMMFTERFLCHHSWYHYIIDGSADKNRQFNIFPWSLFLIS